MSASFYESNYWSLRFCRSTFSNYNNVESSALIVDCPVDNNFNGGADGTLPNDFVPNDSTNNWLDPIVDPTALDDYLDYLINLNIGGGNDGSDGPTRIEIARVRIVLYRWVVHMLQHPSNYDLSLIEDFADTEYQRLMVGYYIHHGDPYNSDRILANLPRDGEVNQDFIKIQEINLKRLFPGFYNINTYYTPANNELQAIRTIAEKYSENTGYASALYYLYTNEKVYPDFDFLANQPRNSRKSDSREVLTMDIYPNPTEGSLLIESNNPISEYALYDSYGRLQEAEFDLDINNLTLDMGKYPRGLYIINVKCGSEVITKKVVKI